MLAEARRASAHVLDLLFPPRCVSCGREGAYFCKHCRPLLETIEAPFCLTCGLPERIGRTCSACAGHFAALSGIRSAVRYRGPARPAIHQLKYRGVRQIAPLIGALMAEQWRKLSIAVDVVIPIPLHGKRLRRRGYNQAELIGQAFAAELSLPLVGDCLFRERDTHSQVEMKSAIDRRRNIEAAFSSQRSVAGKRVVLVDDVCTTGATLETAASAIKNAGAESVWGMVFARELLYADEGR